MRDIAELVENAKIIEKPIEMSYRIREGAHSVSYEVVARLGRYSVKHGHSSLINGAPETSSESPLHTRESRRLQADRSVLEKMVEWGNYVERSGVDVICLDEGGNRYESSDVVAAFRDAASDYKKYYDSVMAKPTRA